MMKTFVLFGLLAVCLFPDSASSKGLSYPCPMVGQDCYGDDIIRFAKISDERSCAYLCSTDRFCKYWVWQTDNGNCYMKHACNRLLPNKERISGYYRCIPAAK